MDRTRPLRTVPVILVLIAAPAVLNAQSAPVPTVASPIEYKLGGAATFDGRIAPSAPIVDDTPNLTPFRFPERVPPTLLKNGRSQTLRGGVSVFGSEIERDGEEVLKLGTALTRGRTTTGVTISYGEDSALTQSELFLDYALTETFSVGVAGIMTDEREAFATTTRLGVSASYAFDGGTFLQGGIADAPDTSPVFGVSLGLRF